MAAISQTTFSSAFSWMKMFNFRSKFHWSLFLRVWLTNIPSLVQIMAWCRPGDRPLSEPMMVSLLPHICVTRPQWVKPDQNNRHFQTMFCNVCFEMKFYLDQTWWGFTWSQFSINWLCFRHRLDSGQAISTTWNKNWHMRPYMPQGHNVFIIWQTLQWSAKVKDTTYRMATTIWWFMFMNYKMGRKVKFSPFKIYGALLEYHRRDCSKVIAFGFNSRSFLFQSFKSVILGIGYPNYSFS